MEHVPIVESSSLVIDQVTVLSLLSFVALIVVAYVASVTLLPKHASTKHRVLFLWHAVDGLCHFTIEASWLYNCFFVYKTIVPSPDCTHPDSVTPPGVFFLGRSDRLYGPAYGSSPTAKLWQEYAKADKRWGSSDLSLISLELLTAFIAGPGALYVCHLLSKGDRSGKMWFWAIIVAYGELYGSFMTFAPEWLSGNPNLDTSNWMFKWLYLFFFNMLWVFFPTWVIVEAYTNIKQAFASDKRVAQKKRL